MEKKVRLKIEVESDQYGKDMVEQMFDAVLKNKSKKEAIELLSKAFEHGYVFAIECCSQDNSKSGYDMVDYLENLDENGNSY